MPNWINSIDQTQALLKAWNASGTSIRDTQIVDDASKTPAICYLLLNAPLSDESRQLFKSALLNPDLSDAARLDLLTQLRAALVDVEVIGGVTAPAELTALPNKQWRFVMEAKLRCDDAPPA